VFAVPAEEEDAPAPKPAAPRPPAPRPKPAPRREEPEDASDAGEILDDEPVDDEPEDDEPEDVRPARRRKKKRKKKGVPLWVWLTSIGGGLLLLCCAGCGIGGYFFYNSVADMVNAGSGSVNLINYTKIQKGMSEAQVKGILGEPLHTLDQGTTKTATWMSGTSLITVDFTNDQAINRLCVLSTKSGQKFNHSGFTGP